MKIESPELNHNSSVNHQNNNIKKPVTLTAKEKARQKAATGTKTISSFFKKS